MTFDPAFGEARGVRESLVLGEHSAKESSSSLAKYLFTPLLEPGSDRMGRVSEIDGGTAGFHEAPNAVPADPTEEGGSASAADGSVWSVRWGAEDVNGRRRWRSVLIVGLATLVVLGVGVGAVLAGGRWLFGDKIVLPATLGGMSLTRDQKVMLVAYDFTADPPNNEWYAKAASYGDSSRFAVLTLYQWAAWDSPRSAESEMQSLVDQFQAMPGTDATTRCSPFPRRQVTPSAHPSP